MCLSEDVREMKVLACVCVGAPVFFQLVWESGVGGWRGYKGETNSSLGDEGKHNYVQFSS